MSSTLATVITFFCVSCIPRGMYWFRHIHLNIQYFPTYVFTQLTYCIQSQSIPHFPCPCIIIYYLLSLIRLPPASEVFSLLLLLPSSVVHHGIRAVNTLCSLCASPIDLILNNFGAGREEDGKTCIVSWWRDVGFEKEHTRKERI